MRAVPTGDPWGLRAVRRYSVQPIGGDVLRAILEAARWTGSSKNSQPWELIVVEDQETRRALSIAFNNGSHLEHAPLVIAVAMTSGARELDAGRVAERIMLAAWAHQVGSCPALAHEVGPLRAASDLLGVPADATLALVIGLGHPAEGPREAPADRSGRIQTGRRPLVELVSWDRFGRRDPVRLSR